MYSLAIFLPSTAYTFGSLVNMYFNSSCSFYQVNGKLFNEKEKVCTHLTNKSISRLFNGKTNTKKQQRKSLIYECKTFYSVFYFTCLYIMLCYVRFSLFRRHSVFISSSCLSFFSLSNSFKASFYLWLPVIYIFSSFFRCRHMLVLHIVRHSSAFCYCRIAFLRVVISNCRFFPFILLLNNFRGKTTKTATSLKSRMRHVYIYIVSGSVRGRKKSIQKNSRR